MTLPGYRTTNFTAAAICALAMLIAVVYFQNILGLEPCYLCITQRVFMTACGALFLLAALHNPAPRVGKIYAWTTALVALGGAFFSAKQLWLQSLPEDLVPVCGPPVDYVLDAFPASKIISLLLSGDGNCAEVQWQLFNISMPGWVLMLFIGFAGVAVWQALRTR